MRQSKRSGNQAVTDLEGKSVTLRHMVRGDARFECVIHSAWTSATEIIVPGGSDMIPPDVGTHVSIRGPSA